MTEMCHTIRIESCGTEELKRRNNVMLLELAFIEYYGNDQLVTISFEDLFKKLI